MNALRRNLILPVLSASLMLAACGGDSSEQFMLSAKTYLAENDSRAAIVQLKNALQKTPNLAEARFLLGKALYESGDVASASAELQRAFDLKYPQAQVLPVLARSLLAENQYKKLIDQYGSVDLPKGADQADLKTSVATAHAILGDVGHAESALALALSAASDFPTAVLLKARIRADQRKFDEASELFDKVLAAVPNYSEAWNYKAEFLLYAKADIPGAVHAYQKALSAKPDYLQARSGLISVYLAQGDTKSAASQLDELHKTLPKHPQVIYLNAQLAYFNGDFKKAREIAQGLLSRAPDNVKLLQLAGSADYGVGALLEAERSLGKALQLSPNLPIARRMLAQTYLRTGQAPKALATLQPMLTAAQPDARALSLAAEVYLQAGALKQAESYYLQASQIDPKDIKSRTGLAMTQFTASGSDAALLQLQAIAAADSGTYADLALASASVRNRDYARALKALDAVEAKQPGKALTANLRGRVNLLRKDTAEARRNFERALALDPAYVPAAGSLAALDLAENKPDQAKRRFEAVLATDPGNLQALLALASLQVRAGGPMTEVVSMLDQAIKLHPTAVAPRVLLVNQYLGQKDAKSALAAAQDAVAVLPNDADALDALGRAQVAAGERNQGMSSFGKLSTLEPQSPRPHLRLADIYTAAKDHDAASQSLKRALAIMPNLLMAQEALARSEFAAGRTGEAIQVAREVQNQHPTEPAGFLLEAAIEASRKNQSVANDIYRATVKKFPSTETAIRLHTALNASDRGFEAEKFTTSWLAGHPNDTSFLFYLGEFFLDKKEYETAERYYRAVLRLQPDHAASLNNVAWLMVTLKKPGAVELAQKAAALKPEAASLRDTLAMAYAAEKQMDKAIDAQKKAVALSAGDPTLRFNLARFYVEAGDKSAARTELETLSKLGDKFKAQPEVLRLLKTL